MNDVERIEELKSRIDSLKVKKIAAENERDRLAGELDKVKAEIKSTYGVEIEDFAAAIKTMEQEQEKQLEKLESMVSEAENQANS